MSRLLKRLKQMQIKSKDCNGYITIYLALSFCVITPLLLALILGAKAGTTRLQAELVADLGVDSVFAEYHKELFRQYGLFFIDDSYGASSGSVSQVERHLDDYLSYNTAEESRKKIPGYYNFQRLKKQYLEIEEVSFATDEKCAVWKSQAIQYMKDKYGMSIIEDVVNNRAKVETNGLLDSNVKQNIEATNESLKEIIEQKSENEELDKGSEQDGISFQKVFDAIRQWKSQQILGMVIENGSFISQTAFNRQKTVSGRNEKNLCNEGSGIRNEENRADEFTDDLLYDAYIMEKYGNYRVPKSDSYLSYETEYILFGNERDMDNLSACAQKLLLMREISNYIYLNTKDESKKAQVKGICMAVCSLCGVPELSEVFTQVTLGLWAYAEAVTDVKTLLQGGKVPLMKEKGDWNLSLLQMLMPDAWRNTGNDGSNNMTALSYEDYLRLLLSFMNQDEKMYRSLDVVELDIRKTGGNENFRIDQCIDAIFVSFGFSDSSGHEYVFSKTMRYE